MEVAMNFLQGLTGMMGGLLGGGGGAGGGGMNLGAQQQQMQQDLQFQQQMNQLEERYNMLSSAMKGAHDSVMTMINNAH